MFWSRPIVSDKINISPGSVGRPPHWHYPGSSSRSPAAGCPPRYRGGWCPPEWWRWWPDSRRECEAPGRREVAPGTPSSVLLKGKRGGGIEDLFLFFYPEVAEEFGRTWTFIFQFKSGPRYSGYGNLYIIFLSESFTSTGVRNRILQCSVRLNHWSLQVGPEESHCIAVFAVHIFLIIILLAYLVR